MSQEFLEIKNEKNRIKKRLENYDPNPLIISLDYDQPCSNGTCYYDY